MQFPDGQGSGSASLIDESFILTAGHCVFLRDFGGWIRGAKFAPGAIGGTTTFGLANAVRCWVPEEWIASQDENYDFAIVALDRSFSTQCGYIGAYAASDEQLTKSKVLISGYPTDKGGYDPYYAIDSLIAVDKYRIHYLISSYRGQSGAAVLQYNDAGNDDLAVGVHTYGSSVENSGARMTVDLINGIDAIVSGQVNVNA